MKSGVCLGGTFNRLHEGHMSMLRLAFAIGSKVYIGLTSDGMASAGRKHVRPYKARAAALTRACSALGRNFEISELDDPYGYSTRLGELKGIVVSEATAFRVVEINRIRQESGFRPLISYVVPLIRSFNGIPLSSTRVIAGECDRKGRLKHPLVVGIGSKNGVKVGAVRDAFRLYTRQTGQAVFRTYEPASGVPEQPFNAETIRGAVSRAREALKNNDLGIGIEAGLFSAEELHSVYDVQYCVIIDRGGRVTSGHGMGFTYPTSVLEEVAKGRTVGEVMSELSGISEVGRKGGAIGFLSHGKVSRRKLTEQAVISALLPRINPSLYNWRLPETGTWPAGCEEEHLNHGPGVRTPGRRTHAPL